jgi:maltooligosyltrehalose trehalohydrolase
VPDPQATETFQRSKLRWEERDTGPHQGVLRLYQRLLALRKALPALRERSRDSFSILAAGEHTLVMRRAAADPDTTLLFVVHLDRVPLQLALQTHEITAAPAGYRWSLLFDSEAADYSDRGATSPLLLNQAGTPELLDLVMPRALLLQAVQEQ